mgnify:CR=1 FL=1
MKKLAIMFAVGAAARRHELDARHGAEHRLVGRLPAPALAADGDDDQAHHRAGDRLEVTQPDDQGCEWAALGLLGWPDPRAAGGRAYGPATRRAPGALPQWSERSRPTRGRSQGAYS